MHPNSKKLIMTLLLLNSVASWSLLDSSGSGSAEDRQGLHLLYLFDEGSGTTVFNKEQLSNPNHETHLLIRGKSENTSWGSGFLSFDQNAQINNQERGDFALPEMVDLAAHPEFNNEVVPLLRSRLSEKVYLESAGSFDLGAQCGTQNEVTVQIFFKPRNRDNMRGALYNFGQAVDPRGFISTYYQYSGNRLRREVRFQGESRAKGANAYDNEILFSNNQYQGGLNEFIVTYDTDNNLKQYILFHDQEGKRGWETGNQGQGNSKNIDYVANAFLSMGNHPASYGVNTESAVDNLVQTVVAQRAARIADPTNGDLPEAAQTWEDFGWTLRGYMGAFHMMAVYCRSASKEEILGDGFENTKKLKVVPQLSGEVSPSQRAALRMLGNLLKKKVPVDAEIVTEMAALISQGDWKGASDIALAQSDFYNNTVKDMALAMSNREETSDVPLNDFAATFVGVVRDDTDARELLTGNFYYRGRVELGIQSHPVNHILASNRHYEEIAERGFDLTTALERVDGQIIIDGTENNATAHPDPAGVVTSRAFLSAHAVAGTNRRPVEFAFRQFMCVSMPDWADTNASDLRIGRDIDRFPGNDHQKFQTTCKGCHTVMDGFRGAFAKVNFDGNFIKHGALHNMGGGGAIPSKLNHNSTVFPKGFVTTDDSFQNFANRGSNTSLFGWRSDVKRGFGMGQFTRMISESRRFSECMVKRVFEATCPIVLSENDLSGLSGYVNAFESGGYNLKNLFGEAAMSPFCQGGE